MKLFKVPLFSFSAKSWNVQPNPLSLNPRFKRQTFLLNIKILYTKKKKERFLNLSIRNVKNILRDFQNCSIFEKLRHYSITRILYITSKKEQEKNRTQKRIKKDPNKSFHEYLKNRLHGLLNLVWQCSISRDHDSSIIQKFRDIIALTVHKLSGKSVGPSDTVCFDRSLFHLQLDRAIFPLSTPSSPYFLLPDSRPVILHSLPHCHIYIYFTQSDWN